VRLVVYDLRGQLVRELVSERQGAGRYQVLWDGRDGRGAGAGAGVYFARLVAADATAITIKMILVK
jgi:flagellar hook assembly protein FlgD